MELEYDYWTGHINEVIESLNRSMAQYIRNNTKVKIGITNNPVRRKAQHEKGSIRWNRMVVKYKTSSVAYINALEKILIDKHWDYVKNEVGGGGGPNGDGPFFLYVLLS